MRLYKDIILLSSSKSKASEFLNCIIRVLFWLENIYSESV